MTRFPTRAAFTGGLLALGALALPPLLAGCSATASGRVEASSSRPASPHAASAAPATGAAAVPVARRVDAHLEFLASDDLGGRETGSVHSLVTGQYVASAYRSAGLDPAGEDGWFQHYPLQASRLDPVATRGALAGPDGAAATLVPYEHFVLRGYGAEGFELAGGLVFAGHGIVSEAHGADDYAGLDASGRFVVVVDGRPEGRNELRVASNWRAKRAEARERGALGMIVIGDPESPRLRAELAEATADSLHPSFSIPSEDEPALFPMLTLTGSGTEALSSVAGMDFAAERAARRQALAPGRALPGLRLELHVGVLTERTHADNVLGMVRGSDPALRDEVVIVSAHNDHVGIARDGDVYNGADDNASGTTALLVAAELLAAGPAPRRSVLFLSVSGEEKGLLGSEWWVNHPTVPLDRCVANVNVDMVGRNDPDAVGATPSPEHEHYNTLVARAVALGPAHGLRVTWTAPEASEDRVDNYYHRSDHYNFAAKGIPVVFFFSGLHEDYHEVGDEMHKIDRRKVARVAHLVADLVTETANADERPRTLTAEG